MNGDSSDTEKGVNPDNIEVTKDIPNHDNSIEDLEGKKLELLTNELIGTEERVENLREQIGEQVRETKVATTEIVTKEQMAEVHSKTVDATLRVFNERLFQNSKPLTKAEIEQIPKFALLSTFQDKESGEKWQVILDRDPNKEDFPWNDKGGIRVTVFDQTSANKIEDRTEMGWHTLGLRMNKRAIVSFDDRRNPRLLAPLSELSRNLYAEGSRVDDYGSQADIMNHYLERSLDSNKVDIGMWHSRKLPSQAPEK